MYIHCYFDALRRNTIGNLAISVSNRNKTKKKLVLTVLQAYSKSKRYNLMAEITSKKFTWELEKMKFKVRKNYATTGKIASSVSFHKHFHVFYMNFKLFWGDLKRVTQKFRCNINNFGTKFLSAFSRTCAWFLLNSSIYYLAWSPGLGVTRKYFCSFFCSLFFFFSLNFLAAIVGTVWKSNKTWFILYSWLSNRIKSLTWQKPLKRKDERYHTCNLKTDRMKA